MFTHVSLFAGLGGFIIAGNRHGFRTVFANEIESACGFVLRQNFPDVALSLKDVRTLNPRDYAELEEGIDVLSAGFPCQSFSMAGENLGFEDERGKLFFRIPEICRSMRQFPKILLLENVPFLKIFDNGARLRVVLNELRRIGYWVAEENAQILDAYDFGDTPQRRERLYIVAVHSSHFKKNRFKFPTKTGVGEHKTVWSYVDRDKKGDEKLYMDPENKYARMISRACGVHGPDRLYQIRRNDVRACPPDICPTLTANMGGGGHNVPFLVDRWGIRRLSVEEVAQLQCVRSDELQFPIGLTDSAKLKMLGNAVCIDVVSMLFEEIKALLVDQPRSTNERSTLALSS
jgi:DNA (cytosine-5)-methyltransferase 1